MVSQKRWSIPLLKITRFLCEMRPPFFAMGWRTYLVSVIIPTITSVVIVVSGVTGPSIPSIVIHVCIVIPILIIPVVIPGVLGLTLHRSYIPHQQKPQFRPDRRHHTHYVNATMWRPTPHSYSHSFIHLSHAHPLINMHSVLKYW